MSQTASLKTEFPNSFPLRRFSVSEYHRMGEEGILTEDERVELIDGVIIQMSPKGTKHATSVSKLANFLPRILEGKVWLRVQDPIILNDDTEPKPDLALVIPREDAYAAMHPRPDDVLLLIEVADTSLEQDKKLKLPRYAASGITEVWIVNLVDNIIEVYCEPLTLADGIAGYRIRMEFMQGDTLCPQVVPDIKIAVGDVLA